MKNQINDTQMQALLKKEQAKLIKAQQLKVLKNKVHEIEQQFTFSDMQCAQLLAKTNQVKITNASSKKPRMYMWNETNTLWEPLEGIPKINTALHDLLVPTLEKQIKDAHQKLNQLAADNESEIITKGRAAPMKAEKNLVNLGSTNKLQNIFKSCGKCVVSETEFNAKMQTHNLLPIKTGVINLVTLKERPRTKDDMFSFYMDVEMTDDTAQAEDFLHQYCPADDEDTYKYLLDSLSYMITPWNFLKKFFVFWGPNGNNGKSALMGILEQMMVELYTSVDEDLFTEKNKSSGAATPAINQCINKFVGVYGETKNALLNENTIKMITGDDTITYRKLYGEAGKVKLFMKLVLVGNYKPNWSHNNPMAMRIAFFPFMNLFVNKVKETHHRKKDEKVVNNMKKGMGKNQLFSLLVRNAASLHKRRKLHKSKFVEKAFKEYICEVDTTTEFINTSVQKKAGGGMTIGQIFDKYKLWCSDNNSYCEKKGVFTSKFKEHIPPRATLLHGNTVYDVVLVSDVKKVESMFVNPDKLDDYMREENKALLNEMEEVVWERDLATEEREELEDALEKTLDVIELQQREILELQKQMQKFYRQGTGEKELQKSVYANVAKQAQGMMKHRAGKNRMKIPVKKIV